MKIDALNTSLNISKIKSANNELKASSQEDSSKKNVGDTIEISDEAKVLISNKIDTKTFAAIQQKIQSGFYDSDEVLNKVADSLLKAIKS